MTSEPDESPEPEPEAGHAGTDLVSEDGTSGEPTDAAPTEGGTDGEAPGRQRRFSLYPADDPRREIRRRTSWIFFTCVAVVALIAFAAYRFLKPPSDGPRVITEKPFLTAANQMCRDTLPTLRPPTTTSGAVISPAQTADDARVAADGIARLAARLGVIPIDNVDQDTARRAWLADWQLYAFIGQKYADLLKAGKVADAQREARTGIPAYTRADKFSRANGLSSCQFYVLLQAPRNSGDSFF
jgi:hypothetical protein